VDAVGTIGDGTILCLPAEDSDTYFGKADVGLEDGVQEKIAKETQQRLYNQLGLSFSNHLSPVQLAGYKKAINLCGTSETNVSSRLYKSNGHIKNNAEEAGLDSKLEEPGSYDITDDSDSYTRESCTLRVMSLVKSLYDRFTSSKWKLE
jgi:hypothetical protein